MNQKMNKYVVWCHVIISYTIYDMSCYIILWYVMLWHVRNVIVRNEMHWIILYDVRWYRDEGMVYNVVWCGVWHKSTQSLPKVLFSRNEMISAMINCIDNYWSFHQQVTHLLSHLPVLIFQLSGISWSGDGPWWLWSY